MPDSPAAEPFGKEEMTEDHSSSVGHVRRLLYIIGSTSWSG